MQDEAAKELALVQKRNALMDNIMSIPSFSGEASAVSCTEFFDKIEFLADFFKWGDEDKKFALLSRLSGEALRWVKPHKQKEFKDLETIIREKYIRKDTPDVAWGKLTNFKQPSGMPVQEFFDKMSDLSHRALVIDGIDAAVAEKSRKAMLQCTLLNNLAPEIKKGVISKDPKTVEQILEFALLEERALKSINPFYSMQGEFNHFSPNPQPQMACAATFPPKQSDNKDEQIRELREKLDLLTAKIDSLVDKRENEQARTERDNSNNFLCFFCGKSGHYVSQCRIKNQFYSNGRGNYQGRNRGNFRGNNSRQRGNYRGNRNFDRNTNSDEQAEGWRNMQEGNRPSNRENQQLSNENREPLN